MLQSSRLKPSAPATELLENSAPRLDPAKFAHVRMRAEAPVARLMLQRPEHNLLNEPMLRELADGAGAAFRAGRREGDRAGGRRESFLRRALTSASTRPSAPFS